MFDNYLEDVNTYNELESYFVKYFEIIAGELHEYIYPYYKTTFSNGIPFMDADPIFSAKKNSTDNILKVIIEDDCQEMNSFYNNNETEFVLIGSLAHLESLLNEIKLWVDNNS